MGCNGSHCSDLILEGGYGRGKGCIGNRTYGTSSDVFRVVVLLVCIWALGGLKERKLDRKIKIWLGSKLLNFGCLYLFGCEISRLTGVQPYMLLEYQAVSKFFVADRALMKHPHRRLDPMYSHVGF